MQAANITGGGDGGSGTLNKQAKSAARSAFESAKQRFFGHLLTSMKTPTLIRSITRDLEAGHSAVVQIVSTGEALMERRLAELPTEEWNDVRIDITPREYVLSGDPDNIYSLQSRFMSSGSRAGAGFRDEDIVSTPDN